MRQTSAAARGALAAGLAAAAAALAMGAPPAEPARRDEKGPAIEALSPSAVRVGAGDFILKVRGRGFSDQAVARWNGQERVTAVIDATTLTVMIGAGDVAEAGQAEVSVFVPGQAAGRATAPARLRIDGVPGRAAAVTASSQNPEPALQRLAPLFAEAGQGAFTLRLYGRGFTSDSLVRWNGAGRPTKFVSAQELHASIFAGDVEDSGLARVTVRNPLPGGGVSPSRRLVIRASPRRESRKPRVLPNPWRSEQHEGLPIVFERLSAGSQIKIFTTKGEWLKTIEAADGSGLWDLTDAAGAPVGSGSYVYLVTDGKKRVGGKLRVIR